MDTHFNRILTPVDLGSSSIPPLRYAGMFAERFKSEVTLIYADELASLFADYDPAWIAYHVEPDREETRVHKSLLDFSAEHMPGVPVKTLVIAEHPVRGIVRAAIDTKADLIIMGTHGRRGWRRALAGSVADGVVRSAVRPVLVVPEQHDGRRRPEQITRLVCPVNFTEAARDTVTYAAALSGAFGAELILVHVAEGQLADRDPGELDSYFQQWVNDEIRGRCWFRELVLRGGAAERVLDCVEDVNADLLVMGAQVTWLRNESVIGTTSERLLRFSPVPVLTVTRAATEPRPSEAAAASKEVSS